MQFVVYAKDGGVVMLKRLWDWANEKVAELGAIPIIGLIVIPVIISHYPSIKATVKSFIELPAQVSSLSVQVTDLSMQVSDLSTQVSDLDDRVDNLTGRFDAFEAEVHTSIAQINSRLDTIEATVYSERTPVFNIEGDNLSVSIITGQSKFDSVEMSALPDDETLVLGVEKVTGIEKTVGSMADERILYTYVSNNTETVFLGQYNSELQWDGACILNIYDNGELINVTEADYDAGNLKSYKQAFKNDRLWYISDRIVTENDVRSGITYSYFVGGNYSMPESINTESDVMTVNAFRNTYCKQLEGIYSGNTSGGSYNDTTGEAYNIKFFDDGTVRTFYVGNFCDGDYSDASGKAWYITKDVDTDYMYYCGNFEEGHPDRSEGYVFENKLTQERINKILEGFNLFDTKELTWCV